MPLTHFYQVDTKSGERDLEKTESTQTNTKTSSEPFPNEIIKVKNMVLSI